MRSALQRRCRHLKEKLRTGRFGAGIDLAAGGFRPGHQTFGTAVLLAVTEQDMLQ
nr:hypothetical protein [Candidatus Sodalis pierantonius]